MGAILSCGWPETSKNDSEAERFKQEENRINEAEKESSAHREKLVEEAESKAAKDDLDKAQQQE